MTPPDEPLPADPNIPNDPIPMSSPGREFRIEAPVRFTSGNLLPAGWVTLVVDPWQVRFELADGEERESRLPAYGREDVRNVHWVGSRLVFDTPDGTLNLDTQSPTAARQIARYLPSGQTAEFAETLVLNQRFWSQLFTRAPRPSGSMFLIAANAIVFVAMVASGVSPWSPSPQALTAWGGNDAALASTTEPWRLLTCMFLHGGIIHLAFNLYCIHRIGPLVERLYGTVPYLALFIFAGLLGSFTSAAWNPLGLSIGASGGVFGIVGALIPALVIHRKAMPPELLRSLRSGVIAMIGINAVIGWSIEIIDNAAHLGGLLGGVVAGFIVGRVFPPPPVGAITQEDLAQAREPITSGIGRAVVTVALGALLVHFAPSLLPNVPGASDTVARWRELVVESYTIQEEIDGVESIDEPAMIARLERVRQGWQELVPALERLKSELPSHAQRRAPSPEMAEQNEQWARQWLEFIRGKGVEALREELRKQREESEPSPFK